MITKEIFQAAMLLPDRVQQLVNRFHEHRADYQAATYLEARVRIDFINPLFTELGWDVHNEKNLPEHLRDVVTEGRIKSTNAFKAPDYLFSTNGIPAFIVEAKKPSVNLQNDPLPALQLRRYGWNAKQYPVGILTDFEELAVYDLSIPPQPTDAAKIGQLEYFTFEQYGERWEEISSLFSRDAVLAGSLAEFASKLTARRGKSRVDRLFLSELATWRRELATQLEVHNNLDEESLNYATHILIDRIIFLRICEDRGIEGYGNLREDVNGEGVYARLLTAFERADERYNSGLFHLRSEPNRPHPDTITPQLVVPDDVLAPFIERLYWPKGPYDFSIFPADVLGQVYEQFLGQKITVIAGRSEVEVVDKPEVRKAGGVYYTQTRIVRDIVQEAVAPRLREESIEKIRKHTLRICDPSCGSGSFLVEVYQYLLDWHLEQYENNDPERWTRSRPKRLQRTYNGNWALTLNERKRILLDHVFGVDIDPQAVEVAKLSLLLKLLEGENESSLSSQFQLFHERVLPDLDNNIKCGNSLVGSAFQLSQLIALDEATSREVNAFDWDLEFPSLGTQGGFDVIVGNPPWLMAGYYINDSLEYLREQFRTAEGKFDLYYLFIEQSLRLLRTGGALGMIVPNKFFHTRAAKPLRELLTAETRLVKVKDFGLNKMFEGATNYSCILIAERSTPQSEVDFAQMDADVLPDDAYTVPISQLTARSWSFHDADAIELFEKLRGSGEPLSGFVDRFATGIQTGSDSILALSESRAAELGLEPGVLRAILRGRDVRAWTIGQNPKQLIFPYRQVDNSFVLMDADDLARDYPKTWSYLQENRAALDRRVWFDQTAQELSGAWYGLMYVERASSFELPCILTPSLSLGGNFAITQGKLFATGTAGVTGLVGISGIEIEALCGILNSDILAAYVAKTSPIYQGGYRKYSAPYLKQLPLPAMDSHAARRRLAEITRLVEIVRDPAAGSDPSPASRERARRRRDGALHEVNNHVAALFDLSASERAWVAKQMIGIQKQRRR